MKIIKLNFSSVFNLITATALLAIGVTFGSDAHAKTLAEVLREKLGAHPSRAELIRELRKHMPNGTEVSPEDAILPKEYTNILFGKKLADYIHMAQDTNPFLHPEAHDYGFMVSNEVEDFASWEYSPTTGATFLVPRFEIPADMLQIGHFSDASEMTPNIDKHMIHNDAKTGKQLVSFWVHPDDPSAYDDFINGGAKNTPPDGYGVKWDYVGIAPNGPRSLLLVSLKNPDLPPIMVKVNLHRKLEGSSRVIPPHKAARSVLATRLWQENVSLAAKKKYGFDFMPEIGAWTLPYAKRSNVVRDPSLLTKKNTRYVYAYSAFSPAGSVSTKDILAVKWLGQNPTKEKFKKIARHVFRLMARPFAYHALVTGLNFEWHSANWAIEATDAGPGDSVLLQDMEALRYDPQIGIWNGGTATSMQAIEQPWLMAKYSNAIGGNEELMEVGEKEVWITAPEFLADEYLWRVRGIKETKSPSEPTTINNLWGYSTIVDVVRNFGVGVMKFRLTNEEVERWMDEEMSGAFNEILRKELKISKDIIPDVTAEQMLAEVTLMKDYEAASYGIKLTSKTEQIYDLIHKEGGITRALWQVRKYLDSKITKEAATPKLQEILAAEADRVSAFRRNTRKNWYDITNLKNKYFLFHENARIIEVRNSDGWLGFFSLEHDGSSGTIRFFSEFKKIMGRMPAKMTLKDQNACIRILGSSDVLKRNAPFGNRTSLKIDEKQLK